MTDLSSKEIAHLKKEATHLSPVLQVGKSGLTEGVLDEVRAQLDRNVLVKIKLLRSAREDADRHAVAAELAEGADATLVEVRGNTVVLYKPPKSRRPRK